MSGAAGSGYSQADQVARYAAAQAEGNERYLNIDSVYDGSYLRGKRVLVVGASRGLGLCIARQVVADGAEAILTCRTTCKELEELKPATILDSVDVQSNEDIRRMAERVGAPIDYLIFNAGYFMEAKETLASLDDKEELKQIDICALGPLRAVSALHAAGVLKGAKVAIISSQAGSAAWRSVQNSNTGGDYGHHMSRAACNIAMALAAEELRKEGIPITILHPGFNRTGMTAKYQAIWDIEGAVEPEVGAKRVLYEVRLIDMERTGKFYNCEDGLLIPW